VSNISETILTVVWSIDVYTISVSISTMTIVRSCLRLTLPALLTLGLNAPGWTAEQQRVLSVTGRGTTSIAATLAQVSLGVEVSGKSSTTVQKEAANRAARVLQLLRLRKVDKLQTSSVTLTPNYVNENNRQRLVGYTANNNVTFRTPTTEAGVTIDEAVKAGATRVDSVSSVPEDAAIERAQSQAIQLATKDAQRQAQAALSSLGLQQKSIVGIQINDAARPVPIAADFGRISQTAAKNVAPTEIVGGEQEVQANVTLQISY
jgi:uncharacterized protein